MPLQQKDKIVSLQMLLLLLISAVGYIYITYLAVRADFLQVIVPYLILFLLYFFILKKVNERQVIFLAVAGILFRLLLLFAIPNLSDDYLRFLWDGNLIANGINPFAFKPTEIDNAASIAYNEEMLQLVVSKDFYSVYPPVLQYIFYLAALIAPASISGGVIFLRLIIILAETGTIFLLIHLQKQFNIPVKNALLYILNPLVIIELAGNLHFEALMLPFIVLSIYLIHKQKIIMAAISFALAIAIKLLPLMLLPFFIKYLGWKRSIPFLICTIIFSAITFIPFDLILAINNIYISTKLYFQYFEFNASIYYILRWFGYQYFGYNIIHQLGPVLSFIIAIVIFLQALKYNFKRVEIFIAFLFAFGIYFMLSTTINPWYVAPLICFSVFTPYRWPIAWAVLIPFTYIYFSDYSGYLFIVALEYCILFSFIVYELFFQQKRWFNLKRSLPY